jgi:histidinol phosphatase-like PHP family hydrolase
LVDALVHPYFFYMANWGQWGWPPFDAACVRRIPRRFAVELGQAARDTGTAIEINACSTIHYMGRDRKDADWEEAYLEFMSIVAAQGATFSVGSDAHAIDGVDRIADSWTFIDRLGLPESRLFRPACRPINRAG